MKTFEHPKNFIDQFEIGTTIYNRFYKESAKVLRIGPCHNANIGGKLCGNCKTEGYVIVVKVETGPLRGEWRWCHSLWD